MEIDGMEIPEKLVEKLEVLTERETLDMETVKDCFEEEASKVCEEQKDLTNTQIMQIAFASVRGRIIHNKHLGRSNQRTKKTKQEALEALKDRFCRYNNNGIEMEEEEIEKRFESAFLEVGHNFTKANVKKALQEVVNEIVGEEEMIEGGTYRREYVNEWESKKRHTRQRDSMLCRECGSSSKLHVHHMIPKYLGGSDWPDNLVTLCESCHCDKHPWMEESSLDHGRVF